VAIDAYDLNSTTRTVDITLASGPYYLYTVWTVAHFAATLPRSYVRAWGSYVNVMVVFDQVFPISFLESGLPAGSDWGVDLNTTGYAPGPTHQITSSTALEFNVTNDSYAYTVSGPAGFAARPNPGTFDCPTSCHDQSVAFTPLAPGTYGVTFAPKGLDSQAFWEVTMGNSTLVSTGGSISFVEPNGTYGFAVGSAGGYSYAPSAGAVTVRGAPVTETITFVEIVYPVTFQETGLPAGSVWLVTLGSAQVPSDNATVALLEPNGSYRYSVGPIAGFVPSPSSGTVNVSGVPVQVDVRFTPFTYPVTFVETGLAPSTPWSVAVGGTTGRSETDAIVLQEPNGTGYAFTVTKVAGYTASPVNGTFNVPGTLVSVAVAFTPVITPVAPLVITAFTVTPDQATVGEPVTFQVNTTGGSAPLHYAYASLPPGCVGANAPSFRCTPNATDASNPTVTVTDPAGRSAHALAVLTVAAAAGPTSLFPVLSPAEANAVGAVLVVFLVVLAAWTLVFRRGRSGRVPFTRPGTFGAEATFTRRGANYPRRDSPESDGAEADPLEGAL
jgi:hypothetical protein